MGSQLMALRQIMASVLIGGVEVQIGTIRARVDAQGISRKGESGAPSVLMKSEHQRPAVTNG